MIRQIMIKGMDSLILILKYLLLSITTLFMVSCVSVSMIPLGDADFYGSNNRVLVYYSRDKINKEYDEIAILKAKTTDAWLVTDEQMLDKLLEKAKTIGADAIIYESESERSSTGGTFIGNTYVTSSKATFKVVAIRFK